MRFCLTFLAFLLSLSLFGQDGVVVLTGRVVGQDGGRALAHVSVSAPGQHQSTVTNDDGEFTLKTAVCPDYIVLSHLGYQTQRVRVGEVPTKRLKIRMKPSTIVLNEVVIAVDDPLEIVLAAMRKIPQNYSAEGDLMHCFYRETARKGSRFIAVSEAVTDMYKTEYSRGINFDGVKIVKGRRLMSTKASDTLGVKMMGGPLLPIQLDAVKNRDLLLNEDELAYYHLASLVPEKIGDRLQYVVSIEPRYHLMERPLFYGKLYIDQQTLAFTRVELQLDMSDRAAATAYMLVRKPSGLRFRPKELSTIINYKTQDGVTRISYVRNQLRFNCDWRRRLFASTYTVVTEMVVTEHVEGPVRPLRARDTFGQRDLFYDEVAYFDEPDFWGAYNIIEPTESLEHAIHKLRRQQ